MIIVVALSLLLNDKNLPIEKTPLHGIFFREERKIFFREDLTTLHVHVKSRLLIITPAQITHLTSIIFKIHLKQITSIERTKYVD